MASGPWTPAERDFVITVLAAFRGQAQDRKVVADQLLRFILADARLDITPELGASVSKWIDEALGAFAAGEGGMSEVSGKMLEVAAAARSGDAGFFDLICDE